LGRTAFAAGQGIDFDGLGREEWILRAVGDNLIIAGGRPRGTLYAVYEFLESQAGCHWLDRDTEIVPSKPNLAVSRLDICNQPAFWWRSLYSGFFDLKPSKEKRAKEQLFRLRNKANAEDAGVNRARFGFEEVQGPPRNSHTFYAYVDPKIWFKKHPEYFADDGTGKRSAGNINRPGNSGSSICVTHPDVRKIVNLCPGGNRQTLFFSATMPPVIKGFADWCLTDPVSIEIARAEGNAAEGLGAERGAPVVVTT
jgi:hypothetical protein